MILAGCAALASGPLTGTWYRAIRPRYLATALHTAHTPTISGRFSSGTPANPQFEILYLTENPLVAMFEVGALLGSLHGVHVPNPHVFWAIVSVNVNLNEIADLTRYAERKKIRASVQELTGDWGAYILRNPIPPANHPYYSNVPTQRLGRELHDRPGIEGFLTYSARVPTLRNLVLFPTKIDSPSLVQCIDPTSGNVVDRIPAP